MFSIALFGTSADPPTTGHQAILHWLCHRYDWVAVWAADNPFKAHQTPLSYRMEMLGLLIETIDSPTRNIQLCPNLSHPRTIYTVERARQIWPRADFTLVIGSDLVKQLPTWYRIDELVKQTRLLIMPRPGYPVEEAELFKLKQLGAKVILSDLTPPDTSSTTYRETGDPHGLTPPIEAYIHRQHLYPCQHASRKK